MKKNTHSWQRKNCVLLRLLAFSGAIDSKAALVAYHKAVIRTVNQSLGPGRTF
ncbi:hypothetical protein [Adhaeribacter arboris]|uniref:hypothetical protein n=1 Tax=Adhaeribacter arboris TaxID=2072846 RepID=UPI001304BD12|nr:hypothetical protein [Adhaeribacter arboris]